MKSFADFRELEEAKATPCGRCGTTHVPPSKGGTCPALAKEEVELDEDFTKMDTPTLKKWITTRERNAMGGNLSKQRGNQYDQAQAEMKKRKANEESELGDLAHQKTLKHRFLVTYSDPNHTSTSMRKEKQQKHVLVPGSKNGVSVHEGEAKPLVKKYMNKQGYRVHDIEHVGMVSKKVNEHVDQLDEADRPSMSVGGVRRREDDEGHGSQRYTGKTSTSHFVHINGRHWKTFDNAADANRASAAVQKKYPDKRVHVQTKTFYEEAEQVEESLCPKCGMDPCQCGEVVTPQIKSFAAFAGEVN